METKINIAELLKDSPKGMELYSPIFGECTLKNVGDYFNNMCGQYYLINYVKYLGECEVIGNIHDNAEILKNEER